MTPWYRGEVWWVDFGLPFGSKLGYRRPAVIVQADAFNQSQTGLKHPSVANVSRVTVSDRRRLIEKVGTLPGLAAQA